MPPLSDKISNLGKKIKNKKKVRYVAEFISNFRRLLTGKKPRRLETSETVFIALHEPNRQRTSLIDYFYMYLTLEAHLPLFWVIQQALYNFLFVVSAVI